MNSLLKAFKEFYNEINGATLTGAIDVVIVDQEDGSFACSPFHVRFGKLGVLRSREKIVDIEVNGEPVDIHMKLGESGEAFFVQEYEDDADELPANLTTSPLPTDQYAIKEVEEFEVKLRRNSTASAAQLSARNDNEKQFENQTSNYKRRRHSEKVTDPKNLIEKCQEYTTEQIRQELATRETKFAEDEEARKAVFDEPNEAQLPNSCQNKTLKTRSKKTKEETNRINDGNSKTDAEAHGVKEIETKSKKKRRKKSMLKKKSNLSTISNIPADIQENSMNSSSGSTSAKQSDSKSDVEALSTDQTEHNVGEGVEFSINVNDNLINSLGNAADQMETARICDLHFFSDTEAAASPYGSRPSTPIQSDSEFEISHRDRNDKNADQMASSTASWKWGEFPTTPAKNENESLHYKEAKQAERNSTISTMFSFMKETIKLRKSKSEGVYLSDLIDTENIDPEVAALYFPPKSQSMQNLDDQNKEHRNHLELDPDDRESGNGTSIPHSPSSTDGGLSKSLEFDFEQDGKLYDKNVIALSLCDGLDHNGPTDEEFDRHLIDYSDICQNPAIFSSPKLVVRLCGKYYTWAAACPIVMTAIAYRKPLSSDAVEQLMRNSNMSMDQEGNIPKALEDADHQNKNDKIENRRNTAGYSWWSWRRSNDKSGKSSDKSISSGQPKDENAEFKDELKEFNESQQNQLFGEEATINKHDDSISSELSKSSFTMEKYRKTLRLTSEQIKSLNLKPGMNEFEFSVTTAYQGTSRCKCYVFRWRHNDKVIISDIDGTITKSDVLGHLLPMVGKDWAQLGVAELFTKIAENGYKLLYLSARAIGQSRVTRDYLRSIQQGNLKLPDGPLMLNPTSLMSAFHREVIQRNPEQFKIACLSDIKALFPQNPFYAGYGNRINDVWAYRAVGIPIIRIFTINPKGELKHELNRTFQSTYRSMAFIVDQLFPPINDREESVEFSSFNYWREPVMEIDCDSLLESNDAVKV